MNLTLPGPKMLATLLAPALFITACTAQPAREPQLSTQAAEMPNEMPGEFPSDGLAPDAHPEVPREAQDPCPYLDTEWLARTNGQKVTSMGVDSRFVTPACVYWSYPPEPQASIVVRHMPTVDQAIEVVDIAAPIADTEPVDTTDGWSGGRGGGPEGAVYAVQKGSIALVVRTNQPQSVKAELIAEEVIRQLAL
ncbi:DUF2020 domain-containing protein [Corynebacterium sp. ES2775-CONJ]|nr:MULTISPECIES: DUF2020 domain-containing protein [unclassified Corynebacterium]MCS4490077.1 DUF2020 domain-containing protein [Corynebacterium sp. ES2775-CONJ]MCS4532222.1 DUF2020 domain-containing protein [Corynebacterium sp. ES2730-CONJ]